MLGYFILRNAAAQVKQRAYYNEDWPRARVAKSADAKDLKSFFRQRECGFKSHPGHHIKPFRMRILRIIGGFTVLAVYLILVIEVRKCSTFIVATY